MRCPTCGGSGLVGDMSVREQKTRSILQDATKDWGVTLDELRGPARNKNLVEARRFVAYELREQGLKLKEIGALLGNRNHTTIMNLLNGKER